jgi:hypothetical protein
MALTYPSLDAFDRLRVSNPETIFDSKLVYDAQPLYWAEAQTGGAAAGVWNAANARVRLTATTGQTSKRQTRRYFTYQPGKSQLIFQSFCMGPAVSGAITRVGLFDDNNGIYFQRNGSSLSIVRRSSSSTPTDVVEQVFWNIDPLNGNGPSRITLDATKAQILIIDYEWLGVGTVRIGFVIDGDIHYVHQWRNANVNTGVYMSTPDLPLRYELDATTASSSAYFDCLSGTVLSEGGVHSTGAPFGFFCPRTGNIANNASKTLISIRHNASYPRVSIIPTNLIPLTAGNGASQWALVYNPTLAGATWTTTTGYCDLDVAGTATGGTVIAAGVFSSNAPSISLDLTNATLTLGADVAGVSDIMSLVVTNASGGNEQYLGAINWIALA